MLKGLLSVYINNLTPVHRLHVLLIKRMFMKGKSFNMFTDNLSILIKQNIITSCNSLQLRFVSEDSINFGPNISLYQTHVHPLFPKY